MVCKIISWKQSNQMLFILSELLISIWFQVTDFIYTRMTSWNIQKTLNATKQFLMESILQKKRHF